MVKSSPVTCSNQIGLYLEKCKILSHVTHNFAMATFTMGATGFLLLRFCTETGKQASNGRLKLLTGQT